MTLSSKAVGNKIAIKRKQMNLSQANLAEKVFISAQAVGKWERGESMPDISTLVRLAEILGTDLNFFSENFESKETFAVQHKESDREQKKSPNWDMSRSEWRDADFSGLKDLSERLSGSNIKNCEFVGSDLSGVLLKRNDISGCNLSKATLDNASIQSCDMSKNNFSGCSFTHASFLRCDVKICDFSHSCMEGTSFTHCDMTRVDLSQTVFKNVSFKSVCLSNTLIDNVVEDCSFVNCDFSKVVFQNATLINTFFKGVNLKRTQFVDCKVDKITLAFLKSAQADVSSIQLIADEK